MPIENTATVQAYTFENPTTLETETRGPISATNVCNLVQPMVSFDKVCAPEFIDVGEEFTVTYTLTNEDVGATLPQFTTVTITDPLFTYTQYAEIVSATNVLGSISTTTGTAVVDLSSVGDTLDPGESITVTVTLRATATPPELDYFVTEATAYFSAGGTVNYTAVDTCGSIFNLGQLTITKTTLNSCPVISGDTITYVITLTNTGTVDVTIAPESFTDFPPLNYLTDIALVNPPAGIVFDETRIYNTNTIVLEPQASLTITFTARVI